MSTATTIYAGVLLLTVLPTGYLLSLLWDRRTQPCGRWFMVALVGTAGWAVFWALMLLSDGYVLSALFLNLVVLSVTVTFLGMLFVAIEYLWRTQVGYRVVAPFLVVPVALQALLWSNPLHGLFWMPGTYVDAQGVIHPAHGPAFFVHTGYGYLLVVASVVLFLVALVDREGLYRRQAFLMLVGWLVPLTTSVVFVFDVIQTDALNPTPLGFLAGVGIWSWAMFRYQLLKTVPVARRTALREMDEGVVILDEGGLVTDVNPAARDILNLRHNPTGEHIESVLDRWRPLLSTIRGEPTADETVVLSTSGGRRYLTVSKTPLEQDESDVGSVVVLKDQTTLIRHEEDLELLKEVLARVLRHDIRNKLNVVRSHGELLRVHSEDTQSEQAGVIVDTADDIIETAEKARIIESLVDADRERYDIDLTSVVEEAVDWATDRFPEAVIELDTPSEAWVRADEAITHAVQSLIENGIVHNDATAPYVRVVLEEYSDTVRLVVEDDGPGMSQAEQEIFYGRSIDQLNHGSGLGLWLVNWVARNSRAQVDIQTSDSGTRVSIELHRSFDPAADADREPDGESNPT